MKSKQLSDDQLREYMRTAYYYYKSGMTQEEIAVKMHLSRQRVNRILSQCVELGIVKISIVGYEKSYIELETALEHKCGLRDVRIAGHATGENAYSLLGLTAGKYLMESIQDGDVIGFSRGRAMYALARSLLRINRDKLVITQLMGSWNSQHANVNVDDIVHWAAERLGASTTMLYAPAVVNKRELRESIMNEPYFQEAYAVIRSCTIAAVGIGEVSASTPNGIPSMDDVDYRLYCEKRAVGEICAHFFDRDGAPIETDFDERTIVIGLENFKRIPLRIGVAGLPSKLPAIIGAIKGGYINALVTDADTAEALLQDFE